MKIGRVTMMGGVLAGVLAVHGSAWSAVIDLNTWSKQGPASNGNWTVAADGSSVFQSINGSPTFFVSPNNYIDTTFHGKFGVETTSDDDFIGFIFGSTTPVTATTSSMFLFDWKQGVQSGSQSGFTLSTVTGGANSIPFANHHLDAAGYDVLATNTGTGKGWLDNTVYDFFLTYQTNRIWIELQGGQFASKTTIFDISNSADNNPSGAFGFYNYSQQSVRYQGFTEDIAPPPPGPCSLRDRFPLRRRRADAPSPDRLASRTRTCRPGQSSSWPRSD